MREYQAKMIKVSHQGRLVVATFKTLRGQRNEVLDAMNDLYGEYQIFMPCVCRKVHKPRQQPTKGERTCG